MPIEEQTFPGDDPLAKHLEVRKYGGREGDRESPWRSVASEGLRARASAAHQERSRTARTADAQYNAPIAPDYATWRENPNRYDIPGVDTIPEDVRRRRANDLLDLLMRKGAVEEYVEAESEEEMESSSGDYLPSKRRLRLREGLKEDPKFADSSRSRILAHEGGHALDHAVGDATSREEGMPFGELGWNLVGTFSMDRLDENDDEELAESLRTLSIRARGHWTVKDEDAGEDDVLQRFDEAYRNQTGEMFADAVALSVLEPRAARREAPVAFDTIQRVGFGRLRDLEDFDKRNEGSGNNSGDLGGFV